jgi:DNA-binding NarL/FixJ family response regulator
VNGDEGPRQRTGGQARILIADDHDLVRDGFQRMLGREEDLELVVGEATNSREAVELCRRLRPDLVLMDVRMPEMDGLEATRLIKDDQPTVSVLVVTTYENEDYLLEALKAGAAGYVLKDVPKRALIDAVRRALDCEAPLNQELASRLIRRLASEIPRPAGRNQSQEEHGAPTPLQDLTPREVDVVQLLAQ